MPASGAVASLPRQSIPYRHGDRARDRRPDLRKIPDPKKLVVSAGFPRRSPRSYSRSKETDAVHLNLHCPNGARS